MYMKRSLVWFFCGTWVLTGCAARRYQSAAIVPTESASRLESQNLGDPGLQGFLEENLRHPVAPWPGKTWDLRTLSLAAFYFNPILESARARVAQAEAATITAGVQPNPSLNVAPGIPSPYLFSLDFAVPIETAGKRGHRRQLDEAKAALAAAIGIPTAGLAGCDFSWYELDSPPSAESLSPAQIQRAAVLNRLDVRRALAQYSAAEAELQLEISRQYPDLQIGPGYTYEERHNFFTIGLSTTLPLFNRNQGPINEAEARRKEAAAIFLEKQAQVIAASERALALYTAALKQLAESDQSLRSLQDTQLQMIEQAVQLGEEDRLSLNGVQLQSSVLARTRLDALARAQSALGELEDAVQRPLDPGDVFSVDPESPVLNQLPKESKP